MENLRAAIYSQEGRVFINEGEMPSSIRFRSKSDENFIYLPSCYNTAIDAWPCASQQQYSYHSRQSTICEDIALMIANISKKMRLF